MEMNGLRRRHKTSLTSDKNMTNAIKDANGTHEERVKDEPTTSPPPKPEEIVWGKTNDGNSQ
jgi:hypothetical protein